MGWVLALAAATATAWAQTAAFRVRLQRGLYVATLDLSPVFTQALREKIDSGLTTRIVIRASVLDVETAAVRALSVVEYSILYRVWEEDYIVRRWNALGETTTKLRRYGDVVGRVSRQRRLPLADARDLVPGRKYQAVVVVEVDPISQELLERVREYIANPGGHRREGGGRGLFGNLARIFFNPESGAGPGAVEMRSEEFVARTPGRRR